jgi:ABC-type multidrug transport system fused ATPase/permease subunit
MLALQGRLVESGSHQELLAKQGYYVRLLRQMEANEEA